MKIIKRDGSEVPYDYRKIIRAIDAANQDVAVEDRISDTQKKNIASRVEKRCEALGRSVSVEEIQDMVIDELDQAEAHRLLLIVQVDGQDHIAKLDTLGKDAIHGQELFMIPDFDIEQVIRAAILRLDDLPDMNGRVALEQRLHFLLVGVPGRFQYQSLHRFCPPHFDFSKRI